MILTTQEKIKILPSGKAYLVYYIIRYDAAPVVVCSMIHNLKKKTDD